MVNRREILKGAIAAPLVANAASAAQVEERPVTFKPAEFDKQKQFDLPGWAFCEKLRVPLTARPTAVMSFKQWYESQTTNVFGPGDTVRPGDSFHGIASEFMSTPQHWAKYGCNPSLHSDPVASWEDKHRNFGSFYSDLLKRDICNWGGFPIKFFKIPIREAFEKLRVDAKRDARLYSYAGMVPGPSLKMRLGQPVVVRFANELDTETSVHLHGGHNPSHSDGFPTFYILQGKSRDYFYPNILPLHSKAKLDPATNKEVISYEPDTGEAQSTMWYHDHGMDATAFNVSKGLAGVAPCFGEEELHLIETGVLPGLGMDSCLDPDQLSLSTDPNIEDPEHPGFYKYGKEPYHNPYDIPLVLQDKVIDLPTGQIAYNNKGHNGYLGDTFFVNGVAWPFLDVENRKYRFRILDGSNARVFRLRILSEADFLRLSEKGIDEPGEAPDSPNAIAKRPSKYEAIAKPFLRIGKDSWLWSKAKTKRSIVLAMASRADIVVDFKELVGNIDLEPGEERAFYLVNTMPQADGRGPKQKLDDGGDPRVLPLPFDAVGPDGVIPVAESSRPIGLVKFIVRGPRPAHDATVQDGTSLIEHKLIRDDEVSVVREFIFERGKGAWQINSRFYDPDIANATPTGDSAEEWVLRNGGGGWWHPIHIHLESHQLVRYEKDFEADGLDLPRPANTPLPPFNGTDVTSFIDSTEVIGLHDTTVLGPNTVARIRMRFRTWRGPFVFHCHNLEHEDMRMMFNFEPVPDGKLPSDHDPNIVPDARTHGRDVTWQGTDGKLSRYGELDIEYPPVPSVPVEQSGVLMIPNRPAPPKNNP